MKGEGVYKPLIHSHCILHANMVWGLDNMGMYAALIIKSGAHKVLPCLEGSGTQNVSDW